MPKRDDKHSMAEDYLTQIKWRGEHPYREGATPTEPEWKYKPVYSRIGSSTSSTSCGIIVLLALLAVAAYIVYSVAATSRPGFVAPAIFLILFGLLIYVTRQPK